MRQTQLDLDGRNMLGLVHSNDPTFASSLQEGSRMIHLGLSAEEWFEEAARWYDDQHQGCPWCEAANCVYHSQRSQVDEYHCGGCDFFVCHDQVADRYYFGEGRSRRASRTMHGVCPSGPH
jgi:hypothetical protein